MKILDECWSLFGQEKYQNNTELLISDMIDKMRELRISNRYDDFTNEQKSDVLFEEAALADEIFKISTEKYNNWWPHNTIEEFRHIIDKQNKEISSLKKQVYEYDYCILRHNVGSHCQKLNEQEKNAKRALYEERLTNFNKKMGVPAPELDYGPTNVEIERFFVIEMMDRYEEDRKKCDAISNQRKMDGIEDNGVYFFVDGVHDEHLKREE